MQGEDSLKKEVLKSLAIIFATIPFVFGLWLLSMPQVERLNYLPHGIALIAVYFLYLLVLFAKYGRSEEVDV